MTREEKVAKLNRDLNADRWYMELKNLFLGTRKRLGLSMTKTGEGAGVATSSISRLENEDTRPNSQTILMLRDFFIQNLEEMPGVKNDDAMLQALRKVNPHHHFVDIEKNHCYGQDI